MSIAYGTLLSCIVDFLTSITPLLLLLLLLLMYNLIMKQAGRCEAA
jgi:hypothetical protein